ncbi:MAG: hypothetical protein ACIAXF_08585 [Phycisphaerales bacterium JB063]
MAQQTDASPARRKSFLSTPPGLITGGFALWVLSFAMSCALTIAMDQSQTENPETEEAAAIAFTSSDDRTNMILTAYIGYTVPILVAIGGTVMLLIGSVRWGVHGKHATGIPGNDQELGLLNSINERMLLSETAKRIAYRHEDIDLLRSTIKTDIQNHDFDAALVLVNEIGKTYGHKEEAEEYRDQIIYARTTEMETKVDRALAKLDETLARHDFDSAGNEALKIQRLYSDSPRVKDVHRKVAHAREQYKHDLEREFLEAAKVDDVDRAMDLLKVLDRYLTEKEAGPFRETARGIIGKKRENLGVQFKIAIHDKEWLRAVAVGEHIIREFPNTRMADEARGMLDLLRERAAGQRAASSRGGDTHARRADGTEAETDA